MSSGSIISRSFTSAVIVIVSAVGAGAAGYLYASVEMGALANQVSSIEVRNDQLRESLAVLEEGMRQARTPLQRKIFELETQLAAFQDGDEGALIENSVEPAPEPEAGASRVEELETRVAELVLENHDLEIRAARLRKQVNTLEARVESFAAPGPASVDAGPPGGSWIEQLEPSSCESLQTPDFVLDRMSLSEQRLGGRLELAVEEADSATYLRLGKGSDERYALEESPQNFAFDCSGIPYMISVCYFDKEPLTVSGTVWRADEWRDPCP